MEKIILRIFFILVACLPVSIFAETGGIKIENLRGDAFGKAVKIEGIAPNAMALCIEGKILYAGSSHYLYTVDISDESESIGENRRTWKCQADCRSERNCVCGGARERLVDS